MDKGFSLESPAARVDAARSIVRYDELHWPASYSIAVRGRALGMDSETRTVTCTAPVNIAVIKYCKAP